MNRKIWGVRYPRLAFDIIGHSLEHGSVGLRDIQMILNPWRNRSKAEGYLNLCLQTGLLRDPTGEYHPWSSRFLPTRLGREMHAASRKDASAATQRLLGSMPYYRFHVELLLAEMLMQASTRGGMQAANLLAVVSRDLPQFLGERLLWIQQSVEWLDSSTYGEAALTTLRQRIHSLNSLDTYILWDAYSLWDQLLSFKGRSSDLTRAEKLCRFLREERQHPTYIGRRFVTPRALAVLLLLILGEAEGMGVVCTRWPDAIEELSRLGVDIVRQNSVAYLASAIKVILPFPTATEELKLPDLEGDNALGVLSFTLSAVAETLRADPTIEVAVLDLGPVWNQVRAASNVGDFFAPCGLADVDNGDTPSAVEVWREQSPWNSRNANFHDEMVRLCQGEGSPQPTAAVLLTRDDLAQTGRANPDDLLTRCPHVYTLLMVLVDRLQRGPGLTVAGPSLEANSWRYCGLELVTALDCLLRALGNHVWSEWYDSRSEVRVELGHQLVGALIDLNVAEVQFGRLELAASFVRSLEMDNACLANQTRQIRQRLRQAGQLMESQRG